MAAYTKWTDDEKAVIRKVYPWGLQEDIEELLKGRSWQAIKARAHKMGIRRFQQERQLEEDRERPVTHVPVSRPDEFTELQMLAGCAVWNPGRVRDVREMPVFD